MLSSDSFTYFTKIEDYFINSEPIGKDAFGPIFFGFSEQNCKPLSIKIVSLTFINGREDGEKIRMTEIVKKEIKILTKLKECLNIIQLIDYRVTPSNIYLFFDYFSVDSSGNPLLLNLSDFLQQISEAIRFFKKYHLVHRDLTPSNIFIKKCENTKSRNNNGLIFQVGGFGMARFRDRKHLDQKYVSPEVFEGDSLSEKSDVWAMGTILCEKTFGGKLTMNGKEAEELNELLIKSLDVFHSDKNNKTVIGNHREGGNCMKKTVLKQGGQEDKILKGRKAREELENLKDKFFNLKNAYFAYPKKKEQSQKLREMLGGMLEREVGRRFSWDEVLVKIKEFLDLE